MNEAPLTQSIVSGGYHNGRNVSDADETRNMLNGCGFGWAHNRELYTLTTICDRNKIIRQMKVLWNG